MPLRICGGQSADPAAADEGDQSGAPGQRTDREEGVNKGLFYARKLLETYEEQGVPASEIDLRMVYHGDGAAALLNDAAYGRLSGKSGPNPNRELVPELADKGVHFEICANTMKEKKIATEELLPDVEIVAGAYIRLIDLQNAGYSYIQVE